MSIAGHHPKMRGFAPEQPLFFSHIPKCAGTSVLSVFRDWFAADHHILYGHLGGTVRADDIKSLHARTWSGLVVAHFNRSRQVGLERFAPDDKQIVTMVRDPWDRVVSGYFYRVDRVDRNPRFRAVASMSLEQYIAGWPYEDPVMGPPMSNFLPVIRHESEVADVLDACCIAVGVVDEFEASMKVFSRVLNRPLPNGWNVRKNAVPRDHQVPLALRDGFRERATLDYAIYDWAKLRVGDTTTDITGSSF